MTTTASQWARGATRSSFPPALISVSHVRVICFVRDSQTHRCGPSARSAAPALTNTSTGVSLPPSYGRCVIRAHLIHCHRHHGNLRQGFVAYGGHLLKTAASGNVTAPPPYAVKTVHSPSITRSPVTHRSSKMRSRRWRKSTSPPRRRRSC